MSIIEKYRPELLGLMRDDLKRKIDCKVAEKWNCNDPVLRRAIDADIEDLNCFGELVIESLVYLQGLEKSRDAQTSSRATSQPDAFLGSAI